MQKELRGVGCRRRRRRLSRVFHSNVLYVHSRSIDQSLPDDRLLFSRHDSPRSTSMSAIRWFGRRNNHIAEGFLSPLSPLSSPLSPLSSLHSAYLACLLRLFALSRASASCRAYVPVVCVSYFSAFRPSRILYSTY